MSEVVPLFKSHYSIGKSILTLDSSSNKSPKGADSIFDIAKEYNLSKVILVEDSLTGFMEAVKSCESINKDLVFGLRLSCFNKDLASEDFNTEHKVIVFAKNSEGCALLNKIYTHAFCETEGSISEKDLIDIISFESLEEMDEIEREKEEKFQDKLKKDFYLNETIFVLNDLIEQINTSN